LLEFSLTLFRNIQPHNPVIVGAPARTCQDAATFPRIVRPSQRRSSGIQVLLARAGFIKRADWRNIFAGFVF